MDVGGGKISLKAFCSAMQSATKLTVSDDVRGKIKSSHEMVEKLAAGAEPIYGLNTGLGANLGHRLKSDEISDFQMQIIKGRAIACGKPLSKEIGRGILLSRILSAAHGFSGISLSVFEHLCAIYDAGLSPIIPEYGSIGTGDLVQNAHFALAVMGEGEVWQGDEVINASDAMAKCGLEVPELKPKDGLALVNHFGTTVALVAKALDEASHALDMAKASIVLSYEGYGANQQVLAAELNTLRPSPGQAEAAEWFRNALKGSEVKPRRIQEALSFRTIAPVVGAAEHALKAAISVWGNEANGVPDNPVILENGEMASTTNFHMPALALALEMLSLSLVSLANGGVQRMQRMMNEELSGLPKYLSPIGSGSAGFVPSQKVAASLLAEIKHDANPIHPDPLAVSDAVEDMAPMTPSSARKLERQLYPFKLLMALEVLVACQAIDLRKPEKLSSLTGKLHDQIRSKVPMLFEDRPMGGDINIAAEIVSEAVSKAV